MMNRYTVVIKRVFSALLCGILLCGCSAGAEEQGRPFAEQAAESTEVVVGSAPGEDAGTESEDILILYTNDVHCAVDEGIGYAGVAALKKDLLKDHAYVTLVDCGDHCQGGLIGTVSDGLYPVQIMNKAGYDYAIPGNHEFDYGLEALHTNMMAAEFHYLSCNLSYTGSGTDPLFGIQPYDIVDYGGTKVAFIGVTTPDTTVSVMPSYLEEDGEKVIDFSGGSSDKLCSVIQEQVDACRREGADYVILMTHLGFDDGSSYSSAKVIGETTGIDVVLDAHSHTLMEADYVTDKEGKQVLRTSTGTKFQAVGQLTITDSGEISSKLITEYEGKDEETESFIAALNESCEEKQKTVIGSTNFDLTIADKNGIRQIRSRETNLGDFCTDAIRSGMDTKIAFVHGGAIRESIPAGDITLGNILTTFPFSNEFTTVSLKGSAILDALEMGAAKTEKEYTNGKEAVGENASLLQVSGLHYTIDTSVESSVQRDADGNFTGVSGKYRVRDVYVENEDGSTEPLDPDAYYSVAVSDFLYGGGDGMVMFKDAEVLSGKVLDAELIHEYISQFPDSRIPEKYRKPQGRIKVK